MTDDLLRKDVNAVDGVTPSVQPGPVLRLVGEGGRGKSTPARMIVGLTPPTHGEIRWRGEPLPRLSGARWRDYRMGMQMVFQDAHSSLNPRKRVRVILNEILAARGIPPAGRSVRIDGLFGLVGLDTLSLGRYPHELSGGQRQRQRIGIARALTMEPSLLVADEPVPSLDISLQGQIINIPRDLNRTLGLSIILISHDLAVVARIRDRAAVMHGGKIVESGSPDHVLRAPSHPCTKALLDAVPRGLERRSRTVLPVETAEQTGVCRFRRCCAHALAICGAEPPLLRQADKNHDVAWHLIKITTMTHAALEVTR